MASSKEMNNALEVYNTLIETLDNRRWVYDREDDKLIISLNVNGEDLLMKFVFSCDIERQLLRVLSFLPFDMKEENRVLGAVATAMINYNLAEGSFDYSIESGKLYYVINTSFRGSIISTNLIDHLIDICCFTVDKYNDLLAGLNDGKMDLDEFFAAINE